MRRTPPACIAALAIFAAHADPGAHSMTMPGELKWADVPSLPPGAKGAVIQGPLNEPRPFVMRLKFPAGYAIPAHWHPAVEHVTVLSGTFHMGTGDAVDPKAAMALPPGSVAIMQPGTRHFALAQEEVVVQVHGVGPWGITYVRPEDDPRRK